MHNIKDATRPSYRIVGSPSSPHLRRTKTASPLFASHKRATNLGILPRKRPSAQALRHNVDAHTRLVDDNAMQQVHDHVCAWIMDRASIPPATLRIDKTSVLERLNFTNNRVPRNVSTVRQRVGKGTNRVDVEPLAAWNGALLSIDDVHQRKEKMIKKGSRKSRKRTTF